MRPDDSRDELRRTLRARRRALTGDERTLAQARLTRAIRSLHLSIGALNTWPSILPSTARSISAELIAATIRRGVSVYAPAARRRRADVPCARRRHLTDGESLRHPRAERRRADRRPQSRSRIDAARRFRSLGVHGSAWAKGITTGPSSFLKSRRTWLRPKLLGVGFAFQEIGPTSTLARWDIGLWGHRHGRGHNPQ